MIFAVGQKGEKMDKYGYIGIETLLDFCENSKDHAVTPNDFMRMPRVNLFTIEPERKKGEWKPFDLTYGRSIYACSCCRNSTEVPTDMGEPLYNYCPNCGADMRGEE